MEGGVINVNVFNISLIPKSTHLFFDDDYGNITDVQNAANQDEKVMMSVWCPPSEIKLHYATGVVRTFACGNVEDTKTYNELKSNDGLVKGSEQSKILPIGAGITPNVIQQIIDDETSQEKPTRLYFFDFDMLLSQFNGLTFPDAATVDAQWLNDYSKYLFSDHIGPIDDSMTDERLKLLKRMFDMIGAARVYIITANGHASATTIEKSGRQIPNPHLQTFIKLLKELLPTFNSTHLYCTTGQKKSIVILRILDRKQLEGGSKNSDKSKKRTRKTRRTWRTRKTRKTRRTQRRELRCKMH